MSLPAAGRPDGVGTAALLSFLHRRGRLLPLLHEAAAEEAAVRLARRAGLSVSADELQAGLDAFRRRLGLESAGRTLAWLDAQQLTPLDLEDFVEREALVGRLRASFAAGAAGPAFAARTGEFARVRVKVVSVPTEGAAREALARVREDGADFAELGPAAEASPFRRDLPPPLADVLFAATPGEVVGPVPAGEGFCLYHVLGHVEPCSEDAADFLGREAFAEAVRAELHGTRIDVRDLEGWNDPG